MSGLAKLAYFGRSAAQGIRHAPFVHAVAVSTIAIALFAAGAARITSSLLDTLIGQLDARVQLTAYLEPGADEAAANAVAQAISSRVGGAPAVISPKAALARLSSELGPLAAVVEDLPQNPLPYSVELALPRAARAPEALEALAKLLEARAEVATVDYGQEAVERLTAIARALKLFGAIGFGIVLLATVVIVAATLQLAIYARRQEIEIQKLVGATDRFVRVPFLLEGVLQGLLGAGLAVFGLWLFGVLAGGQLRALFSFLLPAGALPLSARSVQVALELAAAGATLGLFGSLVAVGRFLRI
jgi:cell division transport system permease protein